MITVERPVTTKTIKQIWIEGLRSGVYQQTFNVFYSDNKVCATQVLLNQLKRSDDRIYEVIPIKIAGEIIKLNDDQGMTFYEIADFIEAKLSDDCRRFI